MIVAAAALENGYHPDTQIPAGSSYPRADLRHAIRNAAAVDLPGGEVTLMRR